MDPQTRHREIGAAWDIIARAKYRAEVDTHIAALQDGNHNLLPVEYALLHEYIPQCRRVVHLQCSHGFDALGLLNLGSDEVIGVDISTEMIDQARTKTRALHARARWYCCDVLHVPNELDGSADLVYTGRGALPWIHDLTAWAAVIARILRPAGTLFIYEGHPLDAAWAREMRTFEIRADYDGYFTRKPTEQPGFPACVVGEFSRSADRPRLWEQPWRPGEVMAALRGAGLTVIHFDEYPDCYWDQFPSIPKRRLDLLPHTYAIIAQRPTAATDSGRNALRRKVET